MNRNSYICKELNEIMLCDIQLQKITLHTGHEVVLNMFKERHPDIRVKLDEPLAIFNYGIDADFSDPIVKEARGIIINLDTLNVVCWPFRKFMEYDDKYADEIDWSTARVQQKIDGSIIKLWFNEITGEWQFSTNSMIRAEDAYINMSSDVSIMDIIEKTPEYAGFNQSTERFFEERKLDRDTTYILELTSPETRVVVPHTTYHLHHTGTRNNITGEESKGYIGLRCPIEYDIHTMQDCLEFVEYMGRDDNKRVSAVEKEGFVVVDANWNRIKVKTPEYLIFHDLVNIGKESKNILVEMLMNDTLNVESLTKIFPNLAHILYFYVWQVEELKYFATAMINIARRIYKACDGDRKTVAERIKKNKYAPFGFVALDRLTKSPEDIIKHFGITKLAKYIDKYKGEEMGYMLTAIDEK